MKSDAPYLQVSLTFLLPTVFTVAVMVGMVIWMAISNTRQRSVTGIEGMIGAIGVATTDLTPHGQVALRGELWKAVSREPIKQGEAAEVTSVQGLTLTVAPPQKPS
jgi:membrane-bound serine protease (ClpP class)